MFRDVWRTVHSFSLSCLVLACHLLPGQAVNSQAVRPPGAYPAEARLLNLRLAARLEGHSRPFKSYAAVAAFSPDGLTAATSGNDGETLLWDVGAGRLRSRLKGELYFPNSARVEHKPQVFSPDGRTLVTRRNERAYLWDVPTGRLKAELSGHRKDVLSISFSPDGKTLATGSFDGTAKLWDVGTGRMKLTLAAEKKIPRYRIFSRLGKKLLDMPAGVTASISPDGRTVLTTDGSQVAKLWDGATGLLKAELKLPGEATSEYVSYARFSPDGALAVTASIYLVALWETNGGRLLNVFSNESQDVTFSPDGGLIGLVRERPGRDVRGATGFYDVATGKLVIPIASRGYGRYRFQTLFSPDGRTLATASGGDFGESTYGMELWDIPTGRLKSARPLRGERDWWTRNFTEAEELSFDPTGRFILGASVKAVNILDPETGEVLKAVEGMRKPASFSPDGKMLLGLSRDERTLLLWEIS